MIKNLRASKKQILILITFSLLSSILSIIHGIFFDLEWKQIQRLTLGGLLLTFFIIFPALLFLEWAFDLNNNQKFNSIEKRLRKLEVQSKK